MIPTATLRNRITIEPYTGSGAYGPVYGTAVENVPARVLRKRKTIRTATGVDVTATAQCVLRPDVTVIPESKITWGGQEYLVLDVEDSSELNRGWCQILWLDGPR